jgi:hypothetical protein
MNDRFKLFHITSTNERDGDQLWHKRWWELTNAIGFSLNKKSRCTDDVCYAKLTVANSLCIQLIIYEKQSQKFFPVSLAAIMSIAFCFCDVDFFFQLMQKASTHRLQGNKLASSKKKKDNVLSDYTKTNEKARAGQIICIFTSKIFYEAGFM